MSASDAAAFQSLNERVRVLEREVAQLQRGQDIANAEQKPAKTERRPG